MLPEIRTTAALFALNAKMLDRMVEDLTPEDWRRTSEIGQTAQWLVGHVGAYRHLVAELMGVSMVTPAWEGYFRSGTQASEVPADLDMKDVVAAYHRAGALMTHRWEALGLGELTHSLGRTMPNGSDTLEGALQFFAWHEAYHLGQLGALRRLAGKPGLG